MIPMPDINTVRLEAIRRIVMEIVGPHPTPAERREVAELLDILAEQQRYQAAAAEREAPASQS